MNVFLKSALVQPPRVLGVRLRPFSAWHALVLTALENPYAVGGELPTGALIQGVLVCRDLWHPGGEPLPSLLRFSRSRWCRLLWWLHVAVHNEARAAAEFSEYLSAYTAAPTFWESQGTGGRKRTGIPWPFFVAHALIGKFSESRAWNMPLTLAVCHKAGLDEANGADVADSTIDEADRILGVA